MNTDKWTSPRMVAPTIASSLNVGLKEWHSVCRALETGRQMVLLRKGGIHEAAGEFEVDYREFLLFPTFLHQSLTQLKPEAHDGLELRAAEPDEITLSAAAVVTDILPLTDRLQMESIDTEHIWARPLIDMRFNYRPENPLYLLIVRAFNMHEPITLANTPAFSGCKSWVPLGREVNLTNVTPAISEDEFERRRNKIRSSIVAM